MFWFPAAATKRGATRRGRQHARAGLRPRLLPCALLWLGVTWSVAALDAQRMEKAAQQLGPNAVSGARALQQDLAELQSAEDRQKLAGVNQFFNRRLAFRDDQLVWGQLDYWASPLETLQQGQGDCEDFAMAKYFSLLAVGMPPERMRLVYVRAAIGGPGGASQAHMVLAYYPTPQAEPLILDNLIGDIRPASRRPDLTPVFSFNAEGLWQGVGPLSAGDPTTRLSRWREVLAKARDQGFLP
ncbi:transglutaminase-like cysteine peptidase [Caldimonas brevitalea]|uniref:Transglutaminase n=1 Tax=Caldimonas brevitalea TaxID=413882 RepID=A0A0G3BQG5_9BURK|nr:transglutaminase-like cysteine peptidase [Caldimonas brevitalea]AKJ29611.1 hypothetical protein AAW51_2920 [Caldimonas brevitalea]